MSFSDELRYSLQPGIHAKLTNMYFDEESAA